ncbi:MAG TPA: zf-TFIIB domain-containing protein [Polyangiaceae bacterium]|nr:zf-TFIIB domain-containing protein [Polyangiaceae bacterium]
MVELRCPACADAPRLTALDLSWRAGVGLFRCDGCQGVLADPRAVAIARKHYSEAHPLLVRRRGPQRCRSCHARTEPGAARCRRCSASLVLTCPRCRRRMSIVEVAGVTVDLCRPCELTYFDRGEFALVCHASGALRHALRPEGADRGLDAGEVLGVACQVGPGPGDVLFVGDVAQAAGEVGLRAARGVVEVASSAHLTAAAAAVGEQALDAASAGGELAAGAAEAVLELLAGVFGS